MFSEFSHILTKIFVHSIAEVLECGVCGAAVDALSVVLAKHGPKDRDTVIETTCHLLPAKHNDDVNISDKKLTKTSLYPYKLTL